MNESHFKNCMFQEGEEKLEVIGGDDNTHVHTLQQTPSQVNRPKLNLWCEKKISSFSICWALFGQIIDLKQHVICVSIFACSFYKPPATEVLQ